MTIISHLPQGPAQLPLSQTRSQQTAQRACMTAARMQEFTPNPDTDTCEPEEYTSIMVQTLLAQILAIRVPPLKEYVLAIQTAFASSWDSVSSWASVFGLVFSPLFQLLAVLGKASWPHIQTAATTAWRFQASLPLSTLCAEVAAVTSVILVVILRRFIVRRRYLPRARQRARLFRLRVNRRYLAFTFAVERNFRLSAKAFPHVMYWILAVLFVWLAPLLASRMREKWWVFVTMTWPFLYALYLALLLRSQGAGRGAMLSGGRSRVEEAKGAMTAGAPVTSRRGPSGGTPDEANVPRGSLVMPRDVDRVLMYWVVYSMARSCSVLSGYLPFAASVLQSTVPPTARNAFFLLVLWMHLPGPASGLQVVYAWLEHVVHTHVKDLRPTTSYVGLLQRMQDVLVFTRVISKENAEILSDNIEDSWMLLPAPMFLFTPGFIANLGCLYAGLIVPSVNSIKTLRRVSVVNVLGRWATVANIAAGARIRWLNYWVAFGAWWHVSWFFGGLLRILPFSTHAQMLLFLWLQVPVFRGAGRMLDFGEVCLDRWASGWSGPGTAAAGRESGG